MRAELPLALFCGLKNRDRVAGNGGSMAVTVQERKEEKKDKDRKSQEDCAVEEAGAVEFATRTIMICRPVKITRVGGKEGLKGLRHLAGSGLGLMGAHAATELLKCAMEGDEGSFRALMTMLEPGKGKEGAQKELHGRSLADIWSAEPRWEESCEETAEVGAGGLEPED